MPAAATFSFDRTLGAESRFDPPAWFKKNNEQALKGLQIVGLSSKVVNAAMMPQFDVPGDTDPFPAVPAGQK